jgi:hypothetical protein
MSVMIGLIRDVLLVLIGLMADGVGCRQDTKTLVGKLEYATNLFFSAACDL